jgi:hypothetical protein
VRLPIHRGRTRLHHQQKSCEPSLCYAFAFLRAAQYFLIRTLTAFRAAADMRRLRLRAGRLATVERFTRPAPFAMRNDTGSSSGSNELRRSGKSPTIFLTSCANSRSRISAPRLASSRTCDECLDITGEDTNDVVRFATRTTERRARGQDIARLDAQQLASKRPPVSVRKRPGFLRGLRRTGVPGL